MNILSLRREIGEIKEEIAGLRDVELEIRPEYAEKLKRIQKQKGIPFKNVEELRKIIENA
ncbi:hypothetical protein HY500_00285 [Candidatus Woesearchaeota archaeon]|nr:hypothetical protein [Candidatus Woesearchaeota archaeon]